MQAQELIERETLLRGAELARRILYELDRALLGHHELHRLVLIGFLSRGHLLLEGLPGMGKTELIRTLSRLLQLPFNRVQFTPDLMPGDILGTNILQERVDGRRELVFRPGPIFTSLLLADEINRASPKTQAALLQAMQESEVTMFGETRPLPRPFLVMASQNPIELEGTYPLPEAQLDRFLFKLQVGGSSAETLAEIVRSRRRGEVPSSDWTLSRAELDELFSLMDRVVLPDAVADYVGRLIAASNPDDPAAPEEVRRFVAYGASPRAAIATAESARAAALLAGRPAAGFDEVAQVLPAVLNHRLILNYAARLEGISTGAIIEKLLRSIDPAGVNLRSGVMVS